MNDEDLIALYFARDERAILETGRVYGRYCTAVARNILSSQQDAEECVSDTWLHAWNAIPPQRPQVLKSFLGRITRNLALHQWHRLSADKRGGGQLPLVLDELAELVSGNDEEAQTLEREVLLSALEDFLAALSAEKRRIFVCRYWYADSVKAIALRFGKTENNISVTLNRLRNQLKQLLSERGIDL